MKPSVLRALSLALILASACAEEEGAVSLRLEAPPELLISEMQVRLRILRDPRMDALPDAPDLRSTPWTSRTDGFRLATVPVRDRLVAVVEARREVRVEAYGVSEPFSLRSGTNRELVIRMRAVPSVPSGGLVRLDEGVVTNSSTRRLVLQAPGVTRFEISDGADFLSSQITDVRDVQACESVGAAIRCTVDFTVAACAPGAPTCARRVFARGLDEAGYRSAVDEVSVVIDSRPPRVVDTSLVLRPPAGSLRTSVDELTVGATAVVNFEFDEPVSLASGTLTSPSPDGPDFTASSTSGVSSSLRFESVVAEDVVDGDYCEFTLAVADVAGNQTTERLILDDDGRCSIVVDRVAPASAELPLTLFRAPAGASTTELEPKLWVQTNRPLPPETLVVVETDQGLLAVLEPSPDGTIDQERGSLPGGDRSQVDVRLLDGAGNLSAEAAPVRGQRLIASAHDGGPLRVYEVDRATWHLWSNGSDLGVPVTGDAAEAIARLVTSGLERRARDRVQKWERWENVPPRRDSLALGVDHTRGALVVHGGYATTPREDGTFNFTTNDVWEMAERSLVPVDAGDELASSAANHWLSYDGALGALLFPDVAGTSSRRLLEWTGDRFLLRSRAEVQFQADLPGVYDPRSGRIWAVVSEGTVDRYQLALWDGATWDVRYDIDASSDLITLVDTCYTWLPDRDAILVYGGRDFLIDGELPTDRAMLLGDEELTKVLPGPVRTDGPREACSIVYDPKRDAVWMFGGLNGSADAFSRAYGRLFSLELIDDEATDEVFDAWTAVEPSSAKTPEPRGYAGAVYHPGLERMVLYGGFASWDEAMNDLWSWDGSRWWRHSPQAIRARRRYQHVLAPDDGGRFITHGGRGGSVTRFFDFPLTFEDVWAYEGGRWVAVPSSDEQPGRAFGHAMVFDPHRQRTVLFGRFRTPFAFESQTWVWKDQTWTRLSGPQPPERLEHAMAYDPVSDSVMVFGGETASGVAFDDTWRLDGDAWLQVPTATTPPARSRHGMASLGDSGVVMAGGRDRGTWFWDGTDWALRATSGRPPGGAVQMAPLERAGAVVLTATTAAQVDTWIFDGTTWRRANVTRAPALTEGPELAPDPSGEAVWLFGGGVSVANYVAARNGTWRFDGIDWDDRTEPPLNPPAADAAVAYHAADGVAVLFGGPNAETWVYESTNWVDDARFGPRPVARTGHRMTYDDRGARAVLFGGRDLAGGLLGDLWSYDEGEGWAEIPGSAGPAPRAGAAFVQHSSGLLVVGGETDTGLAADAWLYEGGGWSPQAEGPGPRRDAAAAYLPALDAVIVFGGLAPAGPTDETWSWDGRTWTSVSGAAPSARRGAAMTYDPSRRKLVLVGGQDAQGNALNDVWTFDGSRWAALEASELPSRSGSAIAYHGKTHELVVFGGHDKEAWSQETLSLPKAFDDRPGIVFELDWRTFDIERSEITSLTVDLVAGGSGFEPASESGPRELSGVELWAWHAREARWTPVADHAASADAPTRWTVQTSTGAETADLLYDPLIFMVRPSGARHDGDAAPRVVVDFAEVTVDYEKPPQN